MPALFDDTIKQETIFGSGGLAKIYTPPGGVGKSSYINVTNDYPWTLSESIRGNAPRVILREYQVNETTMRRSAQFYSTAVSNFFGTNNILSPYENLYQKDRPTGFVYDMPYFSDINFEVSTPRWVSLDNVEQISKTASSAVGAVAGKGAAEVADAVLTGAAQAVTVGLVLGYPKVGITDRPRLWDSHEPRSIVIKFPLFNTLGPDDWKKNRELCELLVNQNLYNKRDFITSIPPVFYELLILGQHYSYASCVTQLTIHNKGNMRILIDDSKLPVNVPDVYEIDITLSDMVMPSKNLFQSIKNRDVVSTLVNQSRGFANGVTETGAQDLGQPFNAGVQGLKSAFNLSPPTP